MQTLLDALQLEVLGFGEMFLRLLLAAAFGFVIGYDRDTKNKPIDFRAYIIVCVATCVIAIMGQELYFDYAQAKSVVSVDLAKIISGVLTGIGFLGAGAIIKRDDKAQIVGSATGASIWASGAIGLCLGFGFYGLAIVSFLVLALILIGGGWWMEKAIDQKDDGQV